MGVGYYQNEIRDMRGNALTAAVVDVFNAGTTTPATIFADAAGTVPLTASPLPAAGGLNLPGKDIAANIAFFADDATEYDVRVTHAGTGFTFRARVAPGPIEPGTFADAGGTAAALAQRSHGKTYLANDYGADVSADTATNKEAFQEANDLAAADGGGIVAALPGTYTVEGIIQDSHVTFRLPDVTLRRPSGSGSNIIDARVVSVTGTVESDLVTVTVPDSSAFEIGQLVLVNSSDGLLDTQTTTLVDAVDASQTAGFVLTATTGFSTAGGTLQVDTEVIFYGGLSGSELTGVIRGARGTTAASHSAGASIGTARAAHRSVKAIPSGTTLTLSSAVALAVVGVSVVRGAVAPVIESGVTLDVQSPRTGTLLYGIRWSLVRWGRTGDLTIANADGGVMMDQGTSDCELGVLDLQDCGRPTATVGAAFWFFQGCKRNHVAGLRVKGDTYIGVAIDDRSSTGGPYDGPNNDNTIDFVDFDIVQPGTTVPVIDIAGSNRNKIKSGTVRNGGIGAKVYRGSQGLGSAECAGNEIASISFVNCRIPWELSAPGNSLHDCDFTGAVGNPTNAGANLVYASRTKLTATKPALGGRLEVSTSLDFPSIAAHSTAQLTVSVPGAASGDNATAHPNSMPVAGLVWSAAVTATDTVTVRVANVTAAAIDPAVSTWRVSAWTPA